MNNNSIQRAENEARAHQEHVVSRLSQSSQIDHNSNESEVNNRLSDQRLERESRNSLQEQGPSPQWHVLRQKFAKSFRYLLVLIVECLLIFLLGSILNPTLAKSVFPYRYTIN